MANEMGRNVALAAVPVIIVALALLQRGRDRTNLPAVKPTAKKHRPKSLLRYYVIGALISALERESTRKTVLGALRLAQRRV